MLSRRRQLGIVIDISALKGRESISGGFTPLLCAFALCFQRGISLGR